MEEEYINKHMNKTRPYHLLNVGVYPPEPLYGVEVYYNKQWHVMNHYVGHGIHTPFLHETMEDNEIYRSEVKKMNLSKSK